MWAFGLTISVLRGRFKVPKASIRTSASVTTSLIRVSRCARLLCSFISLKIATGLNALEEASNSFADPFRLSTIYLVQDSSAVQDV